MVLGLGRGPDPPPLPRSGCGTMAGGGQLALRTLSGHDWVRGSGPALLSRLRDAAVVRPGFLSAAEEETLSRELEPELRRRRYEYDHWDAVRLAALGGRTAELRRGGAWGVMGGKSGALDVQGYCCGRDLGWGAES